MLDIMLILSNMILTSMVVKIMTTILAFLIEQNHAKCYFWTFFLTCTNWRNVLYIFTFPLTSGKYTAYWIPQLTWHISRTDLLQQPVINSLLFHYSSTYFIQESRRDDSLFLNMPHIMTICRHTSKLLYRKEEIS